MVGTDPHALIGSGGPALEWKLNFLDFIKP